MESYKENPAVAFIKISRYCVCICVLVCLYTYLYTYIKPAAAYIEMPL